MVVFTHKEKEKEKWASRVFVRIIMPSNITIKWSIIVKKRGEIKDEKREDFRGFLAVRFSLLH